MNDYQMATQSLKEEKKAIEVYSQRLTDTKNDNLKKALTHALGEEKTHAKMFSVVKKELSPDDKMTAIKKAHQIIASRL